MFLSEQLRDLISDLLMRHIGSGYKLEVVKPVAGGSINGCYEIKWGPELFFLKINSEANYPDMFVAEADGLCRLAAVDVIKTPKVIGFGSNKSEQFLVMEWIEQGINSSVTQQQLGENLARLHMETALFFGLPRDNYMGSLKQSNKENSSWVDFFITERLKPQVKLAKDSGVLTTAIMKQFDLLYKTIESISPEEQPALVHGDLWSGNYLISNCQEPVLIDPAVAYANREVDIAMTTLFGGFQHPFYAAYQDAFPLQSGWEERLHLWNLYPLLIHVNLFGSSYLSQVKSVLNRFV